MVKTKSDQAVPGFGLQQPHRSRAITEGDQGEDDKDGLGKGRHRDVKRLEGGSSVIRP